MSTLFVKNLSGSFNDQNIGHEVINSFCADNGNAYFYIPPYGCLGSEKKDFYEKDAYKNIDLILVFDDVNITNVYKLKQVIIKPIKFESFDKMKDEVNNVCYADRPLKDIDFGDSNFLEVNEKDSICDLKDEDMKVYLLSYKLDKDKVYDFSNDNKFIYVKSTGTRNNLREKSLATFRLIYGEDALIDEVDITIGQKQYAYNNLENLTNWFNDNIKNLCTEDKRMTFNAVTNTFNSDYQCDENNFLSFVRKNNDENYYTNYIHGILNANPTLLSDFFSFLVKKSFEIEGYNPSNVKCLIQTQSMTTDMKLINKLIKFRLEGHSYDETLSNNTKDIDKLKNKYSYTEGKIKEYISQELSEEQLKKSIFIDGQMDLYLYDDNYRIVVENKILSGLNGKHKEISEEINQLVTYHKYLNHLNSNKEKQNKVIILCPYSLKSNFVNYRISNESVPTITYRNLADFFRDNRSNIIESYRDDFMKTINKQALTKEELITYRFIKTINPISSSTLSQI